MTFGFSEKGENRLEAIRSPRTSTRKAGGILSS